jgi:surfeit locus 1 family protein
MGMTGIRLGSYRFAPTLWPTLVFVVLLCLLMSLGLWQIDRAGDKQALIERRADGEAAAMLDLNRLQSVVESDRYRLASVRGHYDGRQQWLLDNRVYRGQAGYHVFTPFVPEGAHAPRLLVNRGWVSVGASRDFLPQLPVPDGEVTLTGRLDAPASVGIVLGEPPLESVEDRVVLQSLDIAALERARGLGLLGYALVIDGGEPGGLQYDWSPIPPFGPEKHLGYAVQWFGLAVALTIIYLGVNTRRDRSDGDGHAHA